MLETETWSEIKHLLLTLEGQEIIEALFMGNARAA
jgi:hypothetical protein